MRLAIADPPYLGRAASHYGTGVHGIKSWHNGSKTRDRWNKGSFQTTEHPDAHLWDDPAKHQQLVAELCMNFDGWVIAACPTSLATYLAVCPPETRIAIWAKPTAVPGGSRIITSWEPLITFVPSQRRAYGTGPHIRDVLTAPNPNIGHTGAKPMSWTRFALDLLGYDPDVDELTDMFPGSGAVTAAAAQTVLEI